MRPFDELKGLTIDAITVEEIQAEIDERKALFHELPVPKSLLECADPDNEQMVLWLRLNNEMAYLKYEVARLTMQPLNTPPWPADIETQSEWNAFNAGIKHGKKLAKIEAAHKGHEKNRLSKIYAAKRAAELFKKDKTARMGDVATDIAYKLGISSPASKDIRRIKGWLNEAEEKGLLIIPPEASKPGAPEK